VEGLPGSRGGEVTVGAEREARGSAESAATPPGENPCPEAEEPECLRSCSITSIRAESPRVASSVSPPSSRFAGELSSRLRVGGVCEVAADVMGAAANPGAGCDDDECFGEKAFAKGERPG